MSSEPKLHYFLLVEEVYISFEDLENPKDPEGRKITIINPLADIVVETIPTEISFNTVAYFSSTVSGISLKVKLIVRSPNGEEKEMLGEIGEKIGSHSSVLEVSSGVVFCLHDIKLGITETGYYTS